MMTMQVEQYTQWPHDKPLAIGKKKKSSSQKVSLLHSENNIAIKH